MRVLRIAKQMLHTSLDIWYALVDSSKSIPCRPSQLETSTWCPWLQGDSLPGIFAQKNLSDVQGTGCAQVPELWQDARWGISKKHITTFACCTSSMVQGGRMSNLEDAERCFKSGYPLCRPEPKTITGLLWLPLWISAIAHLSARIF